MRRHTALVAGLILTGAALSAPVAPAAAAGGTMSVSGLLVTITGSDGSERIGISTSCSSATQCVVKTGSPTQAGTGEPLAAGEGCTVQSSGYLSCVVPGTPGIVARLGGGNDTFDLLYHQNIDVTMSVTVDGGPGNDALYGGGESETWYGGEGNDTIYYESSTQIRYEPPRFDYVSGGPGYDVVEARGVGTEAGGVNISLDGVLNDGHPKVRDRDNILPDVEMVVGTASDDTLVGNDNAQTLIGDAGNDTLIGHGGNDVLTGEANDDTLDGGPGADELNGDAAPHAPLVIEGNDTFTANDGEVDRILCSPGTDSVVADDIDQINPTVGAECESVTRIETPKPTPTPTPTPTEPNSTQNPTGAGSAVASVAGKRVNANKRRKRAALTLACTAGPAACTGTVKVKAGKRKIARGTFTVEAGTTGKASVKLTKKARALLRRSGKVKVKIVLVQASGKSTVRGRLTR